MRTFLRARCRACVAVCAGGQAEADLGAVLGSDELSLFVLDGMLPLASFAAAFPLPLILINYTRNLATLLGIADDVEDSEVRLVVAKNHCNQYLYLAFQ